MNLNLFKVVASISLLMVTSCKKGTVASDIQETGQQLGDVMASIDDTGGSGGAIASFQTAPANEIESSKRTISRLDSLEDSFDLNAFFRVKSAEAARCAVVNTYNACSSSGVITRTFGDCTVGTATFSGTVTYTWSVPASGCVLTAGANITRVPNFTVTGRRGATLTVTKSAINGQVLTHTTGTGNSRVFTLTSDGIRRVFTTPSNTALFDYTTTVTSPITITGPDRANRTITGGTIRVKNNLSTVTCDYTPSNVAWSSSCNCAISGNWSGTCSDGKNTSLVLDSCGTGTLTVGTESETISFDRCSATS